LNGTGAHRDSGNERQTDHVTHFHIATPLGLRTHLITDLGKRQSGGRF
jgi:hypothetical protein